MRSTFSRCCRAPCHRAREPDNSSRLVIMRILPLQAACLLKIYFQRQLQLPRSPLECKRSARRSDGSETRAAERAIRVVELGRVGQIEGFGAELDTTAAVGTERERFEE